MGFLRRLRGDNAPTDDAAPTKPPPVIVADENGLLFVDPVCPHCGARFDPLPKRGKKCPACGEPVVRDRGADDLVRLVRAGDATDEGAEERVRAAHDSLFFRKDGAPLRALNRTYLRTYASLGIRVRVVNADSNTVVIGGGPDRIGPGASSCGPCRELAGRVYDAAQAPMLPLDRCRARPNGICVCRYELLPPA